MGVDASRVSPDLLALAAEQTGRLRISWRADAAITALASAVAAMTMDQDAVTAAIDRIRAPTLLLWGARDQVITRALIDELMARRPDWDLNVFEQVGHLVPWEAPDAYVDAVGRWLARNRAS